MTLDLRFSSIIHTPFEINILMVFDRSDNWFPFFWGNKTAKIQGNVYSFFYRQSKLVAILQVFFLV
ncbi:MAG: hypothetical protein A3K09_05145 [Nitrospinae bacterium RIFCSPLOWO2_12_FULL_47_7]|nr:MAG: hypothetical protein A3K09_05145 [Nitrospinae bacterium RIFCSPLOWO2_12_FULL_47_7]